MDKILCVDPTTPPDPTSPIASWDSSISGTSAAFSSNNRKRKRLAFYEEDRSCEAADGKM